MRKANFRNLANYSMDTRRILSHYQTFRKCTGCTANLFQFITANLLLPIYDYILRFMITNQEYFASTLSLATPILRFP